MRCPALLLALVLSVGAGAQWSRPVEQIRSSGGLPPHVVGRFREPAAFQQAPSGDHYIFDRRGHRVYRVGTAGAATELVRIGPEDGRLLGASAFHLGPDGRFVVADAPEGRERVQVFDGDGNRLGGFRLPGRAAPRITLGDLVLTGIASLQFTGRAIVMNQPELGGLITAFSLNGHPYHTFGVFRRTGHEADRDLHLALNSGLPLVNPAGGYYFVFQAGVPLFRKYDDSGQLLFERHVEGPELDPLLAALPTVWPRRPGGGGRELPIVPPTVRAAAVDPDGYLWIALTGPLRLRLRPAGREGAHTDAPGRRHPESDQPVVCRPRSTARHAGMLRVHGPLMASGDRSSAVNTVTAWPRSFTRLPSTCTRTTPPRTDTWRAVNASFPSLRRQYGPRQQWAEPVTGSSSMPNPGAK